MLTRRSLMKSVTAFAATSTLFGGYAVAEPFRCVETRYRLTPAGWPSDQRLRLAALADIHACEPWMNEARIREIVTRTNALQADIILLLGDYVISQRMRSFAEPLPDSVWANALTGLSAPLGVHAVLGNHDWWEDRDAQRRGDGPTHAGQALLAAGIRVLENDAVRLEAHGKAFWLAGLGDQLALFRSRRAGQSLHWHRGRSYEGRHDVAATLDQITDDAPLILMAHEPDVFASLPGRVQLTLSGHTHGGQVRLLGYAPIVPSAFGQRFAYGHIVEDNRHLVVSGGLGVSGLPLRFGSPPEIVVVDLGGDSDSV